MRMTVRWNVGSSSVGRATSSEPGVGDADDDDDDDAAGGGSDTP
jgi:hypothetical protein